ncbi:extracellular solute-binding protein [Alsobacter sp. SYSU M60028]|uniref:Extracellular solute-binding protein n=1 Tax=Alsobacter ponti TaxID=2962936 RepID=A0ABT1L6C6_9HYPH|nr:extracellular solute-binding protein [Alsobacter ponti]MCP8936900.1 extracellular solute-binding protein [Alsobacter ponti]
MKPVSMLAATLLAGVTLFGATAASYAEEVVVKMWARADRSGPLRAGNIVAAAEPLNAALKAAGSDKTVKVEVFEGPAAGYDADALDILKAFAVNQGPDLYVAAHEWVGEFAKSGYAMDLEDFVKKNPWAFADVIPVLWESTKYKGKIHAIPQDSEIRMFFYNKDMLRKIGKDEAFVNGLPAMVEKGEFTMEDLSKLTKEVVDKGAAQMGILHRPNPGPDYLMTFAAFGAKFVDDKSGQLLLPKAELRKGLEWFAWNAANGVTPKNNTAMSWDEIQGAFKTDKAFIYHQGVWAVGEWMVGDAKGATWPNDKDWYFKKIGWIHAPAGTKGGQPANLSHPIVYVVNPKSKNAELAAQLVAYATLPYYNTKHAVTTAHTAILNGQRSMPDYAGAWYLEAATPMLARSTFIPNHPDFGRYNGILFKALQGVETGRLTPAQAIDFLEDEMSNEFKGSVKVVDKLN